MSQIHLLGVGVDFNLHPRHIGDPLSSLEISMSQRLGQFVPGLGGFLVAYENLQMAGGAAAVSHVSANLVASASADLLVFVPTGKFVVENRQNSSLGRGVFPIASPNEGQREVCRLKEYREGRMVVQWFGDPGPQ